MTKIQIDLISDDGLKVEPVVVLLVDSRNPSKMRLAVNRYVHSNNNPTKTTCFAGLSGNGLHAYQLIN